MKKVISLEKLLIIILLFLLAVGIKYHLSTDSDHKRKFSAEIKLREALQDSLRTYKNEKGEWKNNKRTLQAEIEELTSKNVKLNDDQKELIDRLTREKNLKNIFSAALIRAEIRIDSLENLIATASDVDTTNNTVKFDNLYDSSSMFKYSLTVFNVRPVRYSITPTLKFNSIVFPNKQYITFQFDVTKRKDYPVSFSISNSNPYYHVLNIESYAIPTIQKDVLKPTGWQKVLRFINNNGKYILVGGTAFGAGYLMAQ